MGLAKLVGIEVIDCDTEESNKFTEKDVNIISIVGVVIGAIAFVYGIISSVAAATSGSGVDIKALFAVTWGIVIFIGAIIGSYLAQMINDLETVKRDINSVNCSNKQSTGNHYQIKKPSYGDNEVISSRDAAWQSNDENILVAAELLFDDCGERRYLLGIWNENSPEELEYKLTHDSLLDLYINLADKEEIENAEEKSKDLSRISVVSKFGKQCKEVCTMIQNKMLKEELYSSNDVKRMADYWNK